MSSTSILLEAARKAALKTRKGRTLTGEDIRERVEAAGIVADKPTQWGGVVNSLRTRGVLRNTGETVTMRNPSARGRKTPVYERIGA